jgi:hypothetical protein
LFFYVVFFIKFVVVIKKTIFMSKTTMEMNVFCDDGSGNIKIMMGSKIKVIPSSIQIGGMFGKSSNEGVYTNIKTGEMLVPIPDGTGLNTKVKDYQTSTANTVLLQEALRQLGVSGQKITLHATLPFASFFNPDATINTENIQAKKKALENNFKDISYEGDDFKINEITNTKIYAEGAMQLFDVFFDSKNKRVKKYEYYTSVILIDLGANTIDVCVAKINGTEPIIIGGNSYWGQSVLSVKTELASLILKNHKRKLLDQNGDYSGTLFDRMLSTKKYLNIDITKEIDEAIRNTYRAFLDNLMADWIEVYSPEAIVVAGGGAYILKSIIEEKMQEFAKNGQIVDVIVPESPELSLLRGIAKKNGIEI